VAIVSNLGVVWRYLLPPDLIGRVSLNTLEFLASYVGLAMELLFGPAPTPFEVFLSQGNSTSASGWMRKSSFSDATPTQTAIAHATALFLLEQHTLAHYSQWFPGKDNNVADSLSRDFHLLDACLAALCSHMAPSQMPTTFKIFPLPPELVSTVGKWLRLQPKMEQLRETPTRSAMSTGANGKIFLQQLNSLTTPSSSVSTPTTKRASSVASPPPSAKTVLNYSPSPVPLEMLYKKVPSRPPSTLWHQPIGQTNCRLPATTPPDASTTFWDAN
jgi:hypothetical protein